MYLLIHTMTVTGNCCVVQAQFFHTLDSNSQRFTFVGRRLRLRIHSNLRTNRLKLNLQRSYSPNLRTTMKRNGGSKVKHHMRAIPIVPVNVQTRVNQNHNEDGNVVKYTQQELSPTHSNENSFPASTNVYISEQLLPGSNPQFTSHWLNVNRFDKYSPTFVNFCGADMLRMSREDLIQICGQADGIRLYNALHSKAITPKLTIYVGRENTSVFNAVFLTSYNSLELIQKLSVLTGVPQEKVRDVYMNGPQSIHVQLSNDVIKHIKEETMFSLEIMQDNGSYIFVLKPIVK